MHVRDETCGAGAAGGVTSSDTGPRTESPRGDSSDFDGPESLLDLVRRRGLGAQDSIVERIDAAIDRTADHGDLGSLFTTRAIALQGQGDATESAVAASRAVAFLVSAGRIEDAAFSSALAAIFLDQSGKPIDAIDRAVDALVLLEGVDTVAVDGRLAMSGVRAALALSGFFMRLSAFDLAVELGRRAFLAGELDGAPFDSIAYSFGYICVEAANVSDDVARRKQYVGEAVAAADWLATHGLDEVSRSMLAGGLRAETHHVISGRSSGMDDCEHLYLHAAEDLVARHRLVRGTDALLDGRHDDAIALLDAAIPGLEASSDNHCVVRALRRRSQARVLAGDVVGAFEDASDLAERVRGWQVAQVGRLAHQLARRADLERSTTELRRLAERLADDVDTDAMTGVSSRRWLERHLDELARSDDSGATLMLDVDLFKIVNDTYGHHVGDEVLGVMGSILREETDDAALARFGGEEFVVVLPGLDDHHAHETAERIRRRV
ncbi:MAG: GGDEF domain-containing protein, partial [Ilumatobacter sp.]|uniref:GGDEF domain-containing protein n=1 Tax=Ilumatobacter sp. TaxID=1967498 RepID=UPI003299D3AF